MLQHVEKAVHEYLETKFSQTVYKLWFKDLRLTELSEERAVCSLEIRENHLNALNGVMGGAIFTARMSAGFLKSISRRERNPCRQSGTTSVRS